MPEAKVVKRGLPELDTEFKKLAQLIVHMQTPGE